MKIAFIAALTTFANAGSVHEFFAETNLICSLCKNVLKYPQLNNNVEIDGIFAQYPKLAQRIKAYLNSNHCNDITSAENTCIKMNLCEGKNQVVDD